RVERGPVEARGREGRADGGGSRDRARRRRAWLGVPRCGVVRGAAGGAPDRGARPGRDRAGGRAVRLAPPPVVSGDLLRICQGPARTAWSSRFSGTSLP